VDRAPAEELSRSLLAFAVHGPVGVLDYVVDLHAAGVSGHSAEALFRHGCALNPSVRAAPLLPRLGGAANSRGDCGGFRCHIIAVACSLSLMSADLRPR
jgi:hypothetical protein